MKILFLAPQPFGQDRGTSIAIDHLLRCLSARGDEVDLVTFHLGDDREYPGLTITRIKPPFAPSIIHPGFSWKKVYCDLFLLGRALKKIRAKPYDLIHAVEEASFMAIPLSKLYRIPFVYDMDSSMAAQLLDRFRWLRPFGSLLRWLETFPMRRAIAVIPMCEELATLVRKQRSGNVHVLKDVSLLGESSTSDSENVRTAYGISGPLLMYVGNMESYQGIDLMFESFAELRKTHPEAELCVIGGSDSDIDKYRQQAHEMQIAAQVHLIGPRPIGALGDYLRQADLLISPRNRGRNTPLKIYSYLDSGVAVVATRLPTHTQVMTDNEAMLVPDEPTAMAAAMARLLDDPPERQRFADNARDLIRREHSWESFRDRVDEIFGELKGKYERNG